MAMTVQRDTETAVQSVAFPICSGASPYLSAAAVSRLLPQQNSAPSLRIAQEVNAPSSTVFQVSRPTCAGVGWNVVMPSPSWPCAALPQQNSLPESRSPQCASPPAETCVQSVLPSTARGLSMLVLLARSRPQHATLPST